MLDAADDRHQSLQREDAALLPIEHRVGTMLSAISDIERGNLAGFVVTDSVNASPYVCLVPIQVHLVTPDHAERARAAGNVRPGGYPDWRRVG
jgi:hypothetical protein